MARCVLAQSRVRSVFWRSRLSITLPPSVAVACGMIRAERKRDGKLIGANDLWIASHAMAMNLALVTNNVRAFQRVPRLRVENWVNELP